MRFVRLRLEKKSLCCMVDIISEKTIRSVAAAHVIHHASLFRERWRDELYCHAYIAWFYVASFSTMILK